jgi:hypothetical protein
MDQNETVTLRLPRGFVGQILDGLEVLIEEWEHTAEYHETGLVRDGVCVRECTDAGEAEEMAGFYRRIREEVAGQVSV